MDGERSDHTLLQGKLTMPVERKTRSFLDLYMKPGETIYRPPATSDPAGDIATYQLLQKNAAQETELLSEIATLRFQG